jgi:glucose-1-phosphate cytidylyltransferase
MEGMKVVLFCGGLGTRLREYSNTTPKPMVTIGGEPILWHLMKYYAYFGHREFILCLGYRGDVIERHFAECAGTSAVASSHRGVRDCTFSLPGTELGVWKITLVDTGLDANVGERLRSVEAYLERDAIFLANYSDALSDLSLPQYLEHFQRQDAVASFACVRPSQTFHTVSLGEGGRVREIRPASESGLWINGGFFAFRREIFDHLGAGEDLVDAPFHRLIARNQLIGYRHDGFWACMDTLKDKQAFDDMVARGEVPWQVWRTTPGSTAFHA